MKKLFLLMLLLLIPCFSRAEGLRVVVASDPHYLSPSLIDDQARLMQIISRADGKVTHYTPQIAAAFVDEMLALAPDAVILSGDLTLNGGTESHGDLIGHLRQLQAAGIQVLVIPGNHDVTGKAYRFTAHGAQPVVGMKPAGFLEEYADFGYVQARARDADSLSYVYELTPALWLLMLDANTLEAPGSLREETLQWAETQLQEARRAGAQVIGVSHQNLLVHYEGFAIGFQMGGADALAALYGQYGVKLHLSGHMHLQHIGQNGQTTEIATSSLAVYPHHYGVIDISDGQAAYAARTLNVEAWARKTGADDPNLIGFDEYSKRFFDACNSGNQTDQIDALEISEEIKTAMKEYTAEVHRAVFAGVDIRSMDQDMVSLWRQYLPTSFFSGYIQWMLDSIPRDMRQITVSLH